MSDLRKAAEMALEALEDIFGKEKKDVGAINALRQALTAEEALDRMVAENQKLGLYDDGPAVKTYCGGKPNYCTPEETPEVPCKTDPRAPHGFNRNASHNLDRYVCECEHWTPVDGVYMSQDRVDETAKGEQEPVAWMGIDSWGVVTKFRTNPFGGAVPLYKTPPQKEWVGLTDDEIVDLACSVDSYKGLVQAIEAKLKEKNGG